MASAARCATGTRDAGAMPGIGMTGIRPMKHKVTRALIDYWCTLRGDCLAPTRSDIEPRDIPRVLPYVFILERRDAWSYRFRLAGTGLCNIYGMELRGHNLMAFWRHGCQEQLRLLLNDVVASASVGLVDYTAETPDHREVSMEMVLLPLAQDNGEITRVLGAAAPLDDFPWLGDHMLTHQWIEHAELINPDRLPVPVPAHAARGRAVPERLPQPAPIASLGTRRAPLASERPYLRLVKSENADVNESF